LLNNTITVALAVFYVNGLKKRGNLFVFDLSKSA